MTYLQYKQISLGDGKSVDLVHDVAQGNEERSIAIRTFVRACTRRLQGFRHRVSSTPSFVGLARSGSSGIPA